jgi:transcriptional regulator with XRE-family HTH domain
MHRLWVSQDVSGIVGATIRRIREAKGFSQEGFAQHAGLDRAFYGRVERGKQNISLTTLCSVANGLGVKAAKLLEDLPGRGID